VERTGAQRDALRSLILAGAFDELGLSRKGLLWSVEKTLAVEEAGKSAGGITIPLFNEIDIAGDDFSLAEKIAFEYETLGMGVSGHPAELWRPLLRRKGYKSSGELEEVKPGALVKVAGIPVRPHRPPTKSGRTVVFLSLEDEAGLIDVTVFENVYQVRKIPVPRGTHPTRGMGETAKARGRSERPGPVYNAPERCPSLKKVVFLKPPRFLLSHKG